jgi:hypothetical protein
MEAAHTVMYTENTSCIELGRDMGSVYDSQLSPQIGVNDMNEQVTVYDEQGDVYDVLKTQENVMLQQALSSASGGAHVCTNDNEVAPSGLSTPPAAAATGSGDTDKGKEVSNVEKEEEELVLPSWKVVAVSLICR